MKQWGERDNDACPRCGVLEDATHIWKCLDPQAQEVWGNSLQQLDDWMTDVGTVSEIRKSIIGHLRSWKIPIDTLSDELQGTPVYDLQEDCGWQSFLEGFIHKNWGAEQQLFYAAM